MGTADDLAGSELQSPTQLHSELPLANGDATIHTGLVAVNMQDFALSARVRDAKVEAYRNQPKVSTI
jgi:hypothetical protein